ncbi:MAG: electron transport complex subunit E [Nitrospirota bacterium]|nr:electron transport complex subunit E [Nitrospirota bacterium]
MQSEPTMTLSPSPLTSSGITSAASGGGVALPGAIPARPGTNWAALWADMGADFRRGIVKENPIFRQMLGLCPTLAVTTSAVNGAAMGMATLAVMVASSFSVSAVRRVIPGGVRIPAYIVIIATFVTVVDLMMNAFAHDLHKTLGLFIPLIVVNCIVLGRADAFAGRKPIPRAIADAAGSGTGFLLALLALGAVREVLGSGSLFGVRLFTESYPAFLLFVLPPGAFIMLGMMVAGGSFWANRPGRGEA